MSEPLVTIEEAKNFLNIVQLDAGEGKNADGKKLLGFRFPLSIGHPHSMMAALTRLAFPNDGYPNIGLLNLENNGRVFVYPTEQGKIKGIVQKSKEITPEDFANAVNGMFSSVAVQADSVSAQVFPVASTVAATLTV